MTKPRTKRNKRYQPRMPSIPMMVETRSDLALGLRMSIEALIAAPGIETYNAVSLRLVTLGRVVGKQPFMEDAKRAMLDVFARFERVGKIGVNESEAAILRATAGDMDAAIAYVPVNEFAWAEAKTRKWCAENGVPT